MARSICSGYSTTTMRPPAASHCRVQPVLCSSWTTTSFFMPSVNGRCFMRSGSVPAMQAQVPTKIAPAAPVVTSAASFPVRRAMRSPTAFVRSRIGTYCRAASFIASSTSGGISEPPRCV